MIIHHGFHTSTHPRTHTPYAGLCPVYEVGSRMWGPSFGPLGCLTLRCGSSPRCPRCCSQCDVCWCNVFTNCQLPVSYPLKLIDECTITNRDSVCPCPWSWLTDHVAVLHSTSLTLTLLAFLTYLLMCLPASVHLLRDHGLWLPSEPVSGDCEAVHHTRRIPLAVREGEKRREEMK